MSELTIASLEGFAHFQRDEDDYYADPDKDACGCGQDDCPECDGPCRDCSGDGWQMVGSDIDEDMERGYFMGDIIKCRNCRGSGKAKDMTFW